MTWPYHKRGLYYTSEKNTILKCPQRIFAICQGHHSKEHDLNGLVWVTDKKELQMLQAQDPEAPRANNRIFKVASLEGLRQCFPTLSEDHTLDSFHRSLSGWEFRMVKNVQNKTMIYWYHKDERFRIGSPIAQVNQLTEDVSQLRKAKKAKKAVHENTPVESVERSESPMTSSEPQSIKYSGHTADVQDLLLEILANQRELLAKEQQHFDNATVQRTAFNTQVIQAIGAVKQPQMMARQPSKDAFGAENCDQGPSMIRRHGSGESFLFGGGFETDDLGGLFDNHHILPHVDGSQQAIEESILMNILDHSHGNSEVAAKCVEEEKEGELDQEPSVSSVQGERLGVDLNDLVDRVGVSELVRRLMDMNRKAVEDSFYRYIGDEKAVMYPSCNAARMEEPEENSSVRIKFHPRDLGSDIWESHRTKRQCFGIERE